MSRRGYSGLVLAASGKREERGEPLLRASPVGVGVDLRRDISCVITNQSASLPVFRRVDVADQST